MNVRRSKQFMASFRRLSYADKMAVNEVIETFQDNPHDPSLANHALRGSMTGKRSLSVDHNLRIVFTVKGDYDQAVFLNVGTHDEVYRE